MTMKSYAVGVAALTLAGLSAVPTVAAPASYQFSFSPGTAARGYTQVLPTTTYTDARGYGFEPSTAPIQAVERGGKDALHSGYCTSTQPFYFSVAVPEGNYNVTLTLGDRRGTSLTTVKAEVRRLMLKGVATKQGQVVDRTITVNVRTPLLPGGHQVGLKPRERTDEWRNWDNKLTLEFSNTRPCVDAVKITPVTVPTVYIAGDSTVTDQGDEPWSAWGQILPSFFKPGIAIANYAESGETLASFAGSGRLAKIETVIKPGDYLLIQFGHNDMKEHGPGVGPFTTYAASLRQFIDAARAHGATPVLITSMNRRRFDAQGKIVNTFITTGPDGGNYIQAVRQVAQQENVALIDLNAMSKALFDTMGPEGTLKAFVHYPANTFPGQTKPLHDDTHFNIYGAYELARCVVQGMKDDHLPLTKLLKPISTFDPAHPDPTNVINIPLDPQFTDATPYGS